MVEPHPAEETLRRAVARRLERDSLARRRDALVVEVQAAAAREAEAAALLADEERDVARLESLSPTRIWAELRSTRDTDLDRETAERDAARYRFADAEARHQQLLRELQGYETELASYAQADEEYAAALDAKEVWLREQPSPTSVRLAEIARLRGEAAATDKELRDAEEAAYVASGLIAETLSRLGSARSWSSWDTFGGGGLFSDLAKYDHLDEANNLMRRLDQSLHALSRELADVGGAAVEGVDIDGLTRGLDVWFDNIFSDWAVRERIVQSLERVGRTQVAVETVRAQLAARRTSCADDLTALDAERERLLTEPPGSAPA